MASHIQLILGGARSGKSRFALQQGNESSFDPLLFLATATAGDEEMKDRIEKHRMSRLEKDSRWKAIEEPYRLAGVLGNSAVHEKGLLVIDCVTLWISNLLCGMGGNPLSNTECEKTFEDLLQTLARAKGQIRIVSNEVGLSIVPDNELGRNFRDLQGLLNQKLAAMSDEVFFLVAGIPRKIK